MAAIPEICPKCGSNDVIFIEYPHDHPEHYDGVSEVDCNACKTRTGRWSGKELGSGESEKRFGGIDASRLGGSPYMWN